MLADPVGLVFYGLVCGTLAAFAPSFGTRPRRALIGAIVGIVAAILLPIVRSATGL
tara:strand:+ start:132750 stop:132917 length:168 start_codon:yes stop_codon:yes gene_type:complete